MGDGRIGYKHCDISGCHVYWYSTGGEQEHDGWIWGTYGGWGPAAMTHDIYTIFNTTHPSWGVDYDQYAPLVWNDESGGQNHQAIDTSLTRAFSDISEHYIDPPYSIKWMEYQLYDSEGFELADINTKTLTIVGEKVRDRVRSFNGNESGTILVTRYDTVSNYGNNEFIDVSAILKNTGSMAWTPAQNIKFRVFRARKGSGAWTSDPYTANGQITENVEPGDWTEKTISIATGSGTIFNSPGNYEIELGLVHEYVTWFHNADPDYGPMVKIKVQLTNTKPTILISPRFNGQEKIHYKQGEDIQLYFHWNNPGPATTKNVVVYYNLPYDSLNIVIYDNSVYMGTNSSGDVYVATLTSQQARMYTIHANIKGTGGAKSRAKVFKRLLED